VTGNRGERNITKFGTGCPSIREQMATLERLSSADCASRNVSRKLKISDPQNTAIPAEKVALARQNH